MTRGVAALRVNLFALLLVRVRFLVLALLALPCAAIVRAQYVDASAVGEPVKLTAPWHFHAGDNPAWAAPGFDDSRWQLIAPDKDTQYPGQPEYIRYGWYRIRVKLPDTQEPLALAMGPELCEVYADGKLVGTAGRMRPAPEEQYRDDINVIPLPRDLNGRTVTLAVRTVWFYTESGILSQPPLEPSVAPARLQWHLREAASNKVLLQGTPDWIFIALALSLGMFSLGLFLLRRRSTEYGWVALSYISNIWGVAGGYLQFHHGSTSYSFSLMDAVVSVSLFATAMYVWQFIEARRGGLFRAAIVLTALFALTAQLLVYHVLGHLLGSHRLGMFVGNVACYAFMQITVILLFVRMGISAWRGNRNAQLLLIPFTFQWSLSLLSFIPWTLSLVGVAVKPWTFAAMQLGQVTVTWLQIFSFLSAASMALVLMLRFASSAEREQRLSTEMETARRVQAQLVPAELPRTECFRFEAAYLSAHEVGGDLYQVYPRADGSVMVLVGDVSGKGLKAAMLGTLLVGAANALARENLTPAQMLSRLNETLYGQTDGGFVTCLCCVIAEDGWLTLSNAGHLAPYRNGQEVVCSSGLPLGLIAGAEYAETELQLGENDTLTFLSDGVVEARNAHGELFGFERAQAISAEPARKIAEQAVAFGQEDDITVLKLTCATVGVLA
jgi:hypothetical protein